MDDDECGIDIFALIHSIRKFPVLWIERAHTTTVMRKIAWNQVAAQTGMEVRKAERVWNDLIDSVARQQTYPSPGDKLWSLLSYLQFLPEANKLMKSANYVGLKIERLDDVQNDDLHLYASDEDEAPVNKGKHNFDNDQPSQCVKMVYRNDTAAPSEFTKPVNQPETAVQNDLEASTAEPSNLGDSILMEFATVCERFSDVEFGYGMHVAQQLRELPLRNREAVRQKINTLLFDEITLRSASNIP